ncbi:MULTISPECIES: hypothetical protein [Robiginitalea]|uniref:Competence protein n=1 Tax=Robiginitalea biformata (strain ATCC BAA-864 / DSM 15991 / KCTC 12146 / HTCC2501) TaxID=313596 RepID=A4CI39_ROBBH|nr:MULTISPECIES: hypothetical protein [Robiginitalea]EAR16597.1 hypothetical protein RB2501_06845 [Robiginitalea biformata HTCC2501]MDC6353167.1 hypothetical protein [Robiginitalea sp. PM2]MDC6373666.1 hypothetical protein [Robiginitalea sp. SP8]
MAFDELKERAAEAERDLKEYGQASAEYYKLKAFKLAMRSFLYLAKGFVLGFILLLTLIFLSVAGAYAIGERMDSLSTGFLIVAGAYLVVFLLAYLLKDSMNAPILRKFSEYFYEEDE